MQALKGLLEGESPHGILLSLLEKGLVYADSFVPVRQWLDRDKIKKATARQRVNARVMALQAGRWDVVRPQKETNGQEWERCFDRSIICAGKCGFLEYVLAGGASVLRIREYTDRSAGGILWKVFPGHSLSGKRIFTVRYWPWKNQNRK